jgi:hypothetical protein
MPEEKQRFECGLPVQPRNASENETYSSTKPLQSPARGHGLRAAIAVILGFGLIIVLGVLSRELLCRSMNAQRVAASAEEAGISLAQSPRLSSQLNDTQEVAKQNGWRLFSLSHARASAQTQSHTARRQRS